ncbi:MAG: hypothetical protein QXI15_07945 [Zestosphaera sp.]
MHRDSLRNALNAVIGDFNLSEVKDSIEKINSRKKDENLVEEFLETINFKEKFRQHPLLWRTIDWGNASNEYKKSNTYKKIQEKLAEILEKQEVEVEDLKEVVGLLRELRSIVIGFIERQASKGEQGLRHIHAPGSVAKSKARNLYFGERFTDNDLHKLALRLCRSIAFGDSIGIYSEDEDFMKNMMQLIESFSFGPPFKVEKSKLGEIGILEGDTSYPYVVLLKFIMWLRNKIDTEEDPNKRNTCSLILSMLRSTTVNMFFMPPNKEEKWCTIPLPRLDFFINNWIQRDDARKSLETLVNNINTLIKVSLRESRRKKEVEKVRNLVDLLMINYEMLCRKLIEYGVPDFHALRNIMDIMLDLSARYNVRIHFKSLALVT